MRTRAVKQHLLFLHSTSKIDAGLPTFLTCIRQKVIAAVYASVLFLSVRVSEYFTGRTSRWETVPLAWICPVAGLQHGWWWAGSVRACGRSFLGQSCPQNLLWDLQETVQEHPQFCCMLSWRVWRSRMCAFAFATLHSPACPVDWIAPFHDLAHSHHLTELLRK